MQTVRGVWGFKIDSYIGTDSVLQTVIRVCRDNGMVKTGDQVCCIHSTNEETPDASDVMKLVLID